MSDPANVVPPGALFRQRRYPMRFRMACGAIGAAPLVDVVLLISFFILLNSWLVLRPGVALELPTAVFTDGVRYDAIVISIPREDLFLLNDQRVRLNQLGEQLMATVSSTHAPALLIEADRRISHETLVTVYRLAVDAGFHQVYLATQPERAMDGEGQ